MRASTLAVLCLFAACAPRAADSTATSTATTEVSKPSEPAPPQDPAAWSAAVKPLLAGGVLEPEGLEEWDNAKRLAPASKVFKNVKVLGNDRADTFMAAMQSMKPSLGMGCKACHEKGDWSADTKKDKETARTMIEMAAAVNTRYFEDRTAVSCFTCHRAKDEPETDKPEGAVAAKPKTAVRALTPAEASQPMEKVYKNIKGFSGMEAGHLIGIMEYFNVALGVGCEHCHAENGDWASDAKKQKGVTRQMMKMTGEIQKDHFGGKPEVTCWTCHRGTREPPLRAEGP